MQTKPRAAAVIVAAGRGLRMGTSVSKQFLELSVHGKAILAYTVEAFEASADVEEIIIVTGAEMIASVEALQEKYGWQKVARIVVGGKERQDSVKCGLDATSEETEIVLVHDGVRPFVDVDMIARSIEAANRMGACVVGVEAKDTIKRCDAEGMVIETPKRNTLFQIQTPQTFRKEVLQEAYRKVEAAGFLGTDDASVVEFAGCAVQVIAGSYRNIKITTKEDLHIASWLLEEAEK